VSRVVSITDKFDESKVGGKFAKQRAMAEKGVAIPEFFCLTIEYYNEIFAPIQTQVKQLLQQIDFSDVRSVRDGAESVQTLFKTLELSTAQQNEILIAFDRHFSADTLVSVRASTVGHKAEESEDSFNNPFAGMSETFLYVPRDQILEKLKLCWASGFSQESLIYRQAQSMDLMGFGVAVGFQRMVFGERSFILFTSNPNTAARDFVVVAGYGIGEGVVQERVEVDHYFISRKSSEIIRDIQRKTKKLSLDKTTGYGLVELPVENGLQKEPVLTDQDLAQLTAWGDKIETIFGAPQDIEGTFTADGRLYFLQARPIAFDYSRQKVWTNSNVTESFPGVTTALTYSFARYFYRVIFFDLYRMLGVSNRTLHDNQEPLDRMIGYLGGRVYYCLTNFYLLHKQSPLFPLFGKHWESMIGLSSSFQTDHKPTMKELWNKFKVWARVPPAIVATVYEFFTHEKRMQAFHDWWEGLIGPYRGKNFSHEDPLVLMNFFFRVWTQVGNYWGVTLTTDAFLIPIYGWAEALFNKWNLSADHPSLLSDLLCGDEKLQSVEILLSAVGLAEYVRNSPALAKQFAEVDENQLWRMHARAELDPEFSKKVEHHLHFFGDRGLQELKLEQPSLRDTPSVLFRMIKNYALQEVTVASVRAHELEVRQQADAILASKVPVGSWRMKLLDFLLTRLRRMIRHRENSRYCRSELYGVSKNIFKGIAANFVRTGVLRAEDDIFHLTQEEIFGYIDGTGVTENLQALADLRRAEFNEHLKSELPQQITTLGPVRSNPLAGVPELQAEHDGLLKGLGSSAGKVRGTAKVVLDPNSITDIASDMILIARETDPGWLFLMLASKGMVVERGSMLSHTAITGRKFGIPTIVALPNATSRIPDGAKIEIDGSTGLVTILEDI